MTWREMSVEEKTPMPVSHELFRLKRAKTAAARPDRGHLPAWQQKRVAKFIEEHLAEDISLTALAELVDLSLYHFARTFTQSFGMPPHRYHMARRMDHAKSLLRMPTLSVTQIGGRIGFCETSSFTRAFRKFTGLTPTEYRRQQDHSPDEATGGRNAQPSSISPRERCQSLRRL